MPAHPPPTPAPSAMASPANRPGTVGRNPAPERGPDGTLGSDFRVAAPAVSLPKGGGAVPSIGEKFSANPVTGTASFSVPLPATPARGVAPALALSYDSGAGNGPFGLGWQLNLPSIRRKTDKGLPRFRDSGEAPDTFLLSDAEDLVPFLVESEGTWSPSTRSATVGADSYTVSRYRPRVEAAYAVIERWRNSATGETHWRTISRENIHRRYGLTSQARLSDPDHAERVYEWLLEEERDDRGNLLSYQYRPEDMAGVSVSSPCEGSRFQSGHAPTCLYLSRVSWGNTEMGENPDQGGSGRFLFHLVFDHGGHDSADPGLTPASDWPLRQDPFSNFRPGFDHRTYRLCRRILLFHEFAELRADEGTPIPVVVRSLELSHSEDPRATTLTSIQSKGWRRNGTDYDTATLPVLSFGYTAARIDRSVQLVQGLDDLPQGLDLRQWRWMDLDGEGLNGLLTEQGNTWFYKRNEGGGKLGLPVRLGQRPNLNLSGSGAQLADLDGDGNLDLIVERPQFAGFFARATDGTWEPFRPFRERPIGRYGTLADPNSRMIDLDGDGHADVLISGDDVYRWHPSKGREGFGADLRLPMATDEAQGPRLVFSREGEQIFLADMTGDGLTDLVRIRNGSVCYWPNRGYGRFGARVIMEDAPRFDHPDRFDPRRIRLGDVDGTGPADLVYVGPDSVRLWLNQSGNAWSEATTLPMGGLAAPNEVQLADLRGDGTACLVWSSPLLSQGHAPLCYLRLMADGKPNLLSTVQNGLGGETRLSYRPSTEFYTEDRRAGRPWATKLPFPVFCLSKVERIDHITGWRFTSEYAYHHGYFDGPEREFRGFGMVEQWDTERLQDWDTPPSGATITAVPPVHTKSWFHTGAWRQQGSLVAAYAAEYFEGDPDAPHLAAPQLPTDLSTRDTREALRALKGRPLRVEVYSDDSEGEPDHLYTVSETTWGLRRLQPSKNTAPACFAVDSAQSLSFEYDLDLTAETLSPDPRVSQQLTLEVDDYGTVIRAAALSYPRRPPETGSHDAEQVALHVLITESTPLHDDGRLVSDDLWRLGLPLESKVHELHNAGSYAALVGEIATVSALNTTLAALTSGDLLSYEETPSTTVTQLRLIGHQRTLYRDEAETDAALAFGEIGLHALVYQRYALAMTPGLLTEVYDTLLSGIDLADLGYIDLLEDGAAWVPSGRVLQDNTRFYLPSTHIDPFAGETSVGYDDYDLVAVEVTDPLGLTVTATLDYNTLGPVTVTDPNGTIAEAAFDALGRVLSTARRNGAEGDGTGEWSAEFTYETDRFETDGQPARVYSKLREVFGGSDWLESYAYSNGSGKVIQTLTEAAPDASTPTTPRWVASGRVEVDNKGNVVRQFEPFYTESTDYDLVAVGVSATLSYDPIGRNRRVDLPDGSFRRFLYSPWGVQAWDENDNDSIGLHADTPLSTALDAMGRPYESIEMPDASTGYSTKVELDIGGNARSVTDPRANVIQVQRHDLLGRALFTGAADEGYDGSSGKGESRVLPDAVGQAATTWRSGGLTLRRVYDAGRRPLGLYVDEGAGERLVELTVYGDAVTDADAGDFALGRPLQVYDTAGRVTFAYDFAGRVAEQSRQVLSDITAEADWIDLVGLGTLADIEAETVIGDLEVETFTVATSYDALDRVTEQQAPDTSRTVPAYDAGGKLYSVQVYLRGDGSPTDFVTGIMYNARGQRESITYANNTETSYEYDAQRLWLNRILTNRSSASTHGAATLQDLGYTRDAVGNITGITDDAQEEVFFDNEQFTADRTFVYDALYRLLEATGREKVGQTQTTAWYSAYAGTPGSIPDETDPALRTYAQSYTYDEAGNILEMAHVPSAGSNWTRYYQIAAGNNQLLRSSFTGDDPEDPDNYTDVYAYNDRGAMVTMPHLRPAEDPNITRDFRDQIRTALLVNSAESAWYSNDAGGQRVRKLIVKASSTEERIYVGPYEVWRERNGSGDLQEERTTLHVMDGERRVAMAETLTFTEGDEVGSPEPRLRYQLDDHLGTALLEVDQGGGVISYEEFHPYGTTAWWAEKAGIQVSTKRYRYTGMERDDETGLQYHSARYYAPWLGRWASADPVGLRGGANRWSYVQGRVILQLDPTGTEPAPWLPLPVLMPDLTPVPAQPIPPAAGGGAGWVGAALTGGAAGAIAGAATFQSPFSEAMVANARYREEHGLDFQQRGNAINHADEVDPPTLTDEPFGWAYNHIRPPKEQCLVSDYTLTASRQTWTDDYGSEWLKVEDGRWIKTFQAKDAPGGLGEVGFGPGNTTGGVGNASKVAAWTPGKQLWSKGKLGEHYLKHGDEVGAAGQRAYSDAAVAFGTAENTGQFLDTTVGAYFYRFEPATHRVFVGTTEGQQIKTFYRWDGRTDDTVILALQEAGKL